MAFARAARDDDAFASIRYGLDFTRISFTFYNVEEALQL